MTAPPRSPATGAAFVGELVAHDAAQPREAVVGAGLGGEVVARPPVADEAEGHIGARHRVSAKRSAAACVSARSLRRNFSRAGVA